MINVRSGTALPPLRSPAVILNRPANIPDSEKQTSFLRIWNVPAGTGGFKSLGQGADPGPSQGPSMTSHTPPLVYKGTSRAGKTVHCPQQNIRSSPPSLLVHQKPDGIHTLLEASLGTPYKLLPSYPCIGHYSPPSPSPATFKRAPSTDHASRSLTWPSKGPCCRCFW